MVAFPIQILEKHKRASNMYCIIMYPRITLWLYNALRVFKQKQWFSQFNQSFNPKLSGIPFIVRDSLIQLDFLTRVQTSLNNHDLLVFIVINVVVCVLASGYTVKDKDFKFGKSECKFDVDADAANWAHVQ